MTVKEYCLQIGDLLRNEEDEWSSLFYSFYKKLDIFKNETLKEIISVYGGQGSFNDLVLYNDVNKNNELDNLRVELYKKVIEELTAG